MSTQNFVPLKQTVFSALFFDPNGEPKKLDPGAGPLCATYAVQSSQRIHEQKIESWSY